MAANEPYKVGYRRPPKHSQFIAGQSGNPKGRPPGAKNIATVLAKLLSAKISVAENGRRRRISKQEVMLTQLVNKATAGDLRSIQILLSMHYMIDQQTEAAKAAATSTLSQADEAVLQNFYARIKKSK
jgi:hypothetical protein